MKTLRNIDVSVELDEKCDLRFPFCMINKIARVTKSRFFWLGFLVAALVSAAIYFLMQSSEYGKVEVAFNEQADSIHKNFKRSVIVGDKVLDIARSIFVALPADQKHTWTLYMDRRTRQSISYGAVSFNFMAYEWVPGNENQGKCPIKMHTSLQKGEKIDVLNGCKDPHLRKHLLALKDSGQDGVYFFDKMESGSTPSLNFYAPVYTSLNIPQTVEDRKSAFVGWTSFAVRFDVLIKNLLEGMKGIGIELYKGQPSAESLIVSNLKENPEASLAFYKDASLQIGGSDYTVRYHYSYGKTLVPLSTPIFILGILFSLLSGLFFWTVSTNRERALSLAENMSESLLKSEKKVRNLLVNSPGAIYTRTHDEAWQVTFMSNYIENLTGVSADSFLTHKDFDKIIYAGDLERVRNDINGGLRRDGSYEVEYRILTKKDKLIWVMDKGHLETENGHDVVRGIIFDITKTKQIEEKSHQLNYALRHMAEGIAHVNPFGEILEINPAITEITGWNYEGGRSFDLLKMIDPMDQEVVQHAFQSLLNQERTRCEVRGVRPDGSGFYMSLLLVGLYSGSGRFLGAYSFINDITDRKTSEEQLKTAQFEITKAYRTKSEFLGTLSHEMRNLLNVIINYSDLLSEDIDRSNQNIVDEVTHIQRAGANLLNLVNDIIDISKLESGYATINANIFDIQDMVENVVSTASSLMTANHNQLVVQLEEGIGLMNTDFGKVRQSLMNFLTNAAKFTMKNQITLKVESQGTMREWIVFSVADRGCGIPADKLQYIFTPFAMNEPETRAEGSTGLGLAVVKQFAELLGGQLYVDSVVGQGSIFTLYVPRGDISESLDVGETLKEETESRLQEEIG